MGVKTSLRFERDAVEYLRWCRRLGFGLRTPNHVAPGSGL